MKKLIIIALVIFTIGLVIQSVNIEAKTTCKTSNRKKVCYYYKGDSKTYNKRIITKIRKNKKKSYREYVYRNYKGIRLKTKRYYYNKKGQLRTNRYGKAKRIIYKYYSNNKVKIKITQKYNSRKKLVNKKKKLYKHNKPKSSKQKKLPEGYYWKNGIPCTMIGQNEYCLTDW